MHICSDNMRIVVRRGSADVLVTIFCWTRLWRMWFLFKRVRGHLITHGCYHHCIGRMDGARALSGHGRGSCASMQRHKVSKYMVSHREDSLVRLCNKILGILDLVTGSSKEGYMPLRGNVDKISVNCKFCNGDTCHSYQGMTQQWEEMAHYHVQVDRWRTQYHHCWLVRRMESSNKYWGTIIYWSESTHWRTSRSCAGSWEWEGITRGFF